MVTNRFPCRVYLGLQIQLARLQLLLLLFVFSLNVLFQTGYNYPKLYLHIRVKVLKRHIHLVKGLSVHCVFNFS